MQSNMEKKEKEELLVLGDFVGRLLESFSVELRSEALNDIEVVELHYCGCDDEYPGLKPKLTSQLRRTEHSKRNPNRDPRLKKRKIIHSYGEAIQSYLSSIPHELATDILKDICNIVSYYGSNAKKEDKSMQDSWLRRTIGVFSDGHKPTSGCSSSFIDVI